MTQFAGHGASLGEGQDVSTQNLTAAASQLAGQLISSNSPVPIPPAPPPTTDSATFISDVTLPDGSVVSPGQALVKTWRMQNTGSTIWGSGYQLAFVGGAQMGAPSAVNVPTTSPGGTADLSVNLTAPTTPGEYYGNYRLRNPNGTYFGDTIWVKIKVQGAAQPDDVEILSVSYPTTVEPGQTFRPEVTVRVNSGSLLQSRGDMLRNTDGNLYGAWPHVAVEGSVGTGQTYTFRFYENNPITAPSTEGTYTTRWRVWADGRFVGPEVTIEFRVFDGNYPPYPPSLNSPDDYEQVYDTPLLYVSHQGDPDGDPITGYQFEITAGPTTWTGGWESAPNAMPPPLPHGQYTWHAHVRDNHGNVSDWSPDWHFTRIEGVQITRFEFDPPSPSAQEHITIRTDGNVDTGETIIQFNTANDGTTNGEWKGIRHYAGSLELETDWYNIDAVTDGTHVVRLTINANEGTDVQEKTYTLLHRRPAAPYGEWPVPVDWVKAWTNSRTVTFRWRTGLPRTDSYHLVVSDSPNPISDPTPLLDRTFYEETTEHTHTFNTDYEELYWYIAASNDIGTTVGGDSYNFGIDLDSPTSAVETLSAVTYDTTFTVHWNGSDPRSGLRWYDIQVRDGKRGEWADWLVNTDETAAIFSGQPGHEYCFRSRAMDQVGNWEEYPAGDGDTCTLVDPTSAPPTAWWDQDYAYKRNVIVLNNDSHTLPSGYPVHVYFDASTTPTAEELYNASQSPTEGDDFRVVYNDSTQLDRYVRRFTSSEIDIWFQTQADISPSTSDGNYQLYYGNLSPGSPPGDINTVMVPPNDANTVGLWHFQEGSGSTVSDSSGRGHHGTVEGSATWLAEGKWGPCLNFDGADSNYINAGSSSDFNFSNFTVEAWVYRDPSWHSGRIASRWKQFGSSDPILWTFELKNDQAEFWAEAGAPWLTDGPVSSGVWTHLAATLDNSTMKIYVNGVERASQSHSESLGSTSGPLALAGRLMARYQHIRVSNIARTSFPYAQFAQITDEPSVAAGNAISQPSSGSADLVLQSLSTYPVDGQTFESGVIAQAIVKNQGDASTINGFYTDFYADHLPTGPNDFTGSIRFLVNDPIAAGATVTLATVITELASVGGLSALDELDAMEESSATLYCQTDSTGVVGEPDNTNNIHSAGAEICVAAPDAYEGDDNGTSTTNVLALNSFQSHNFHALADEDWLKIEASGGVTYTIRTSNLGISADTYLYLHDTDGTTLLAANDDYGGTLASQIEWTAPTTATYYLAVKHWNPNVGGCGTSYGLSIGEAGAGQPVYLPIIVKGYTGQTAQGSSQALPTPTATPPYTLIPTLTLEATPIATAEPSSD